MKYATFFLIIALFNTLNTILAYALFHGVGVTLPFTNTDNLTRDYLHGALSVIVTAGIGAFVCWIAQRILSSSNQKASP